MIYKKLRCNSVNIRFSRKKILNYAYVLKNGVGLHNIFFLIFTQSLLNPPLYRFRVWSVNIFIYNMCFFSANNFAHAQTLYRKRSLCRSSMVIWSYSWIYDYYAGKHWMLYWMQENQTATYFLRSMLFTYDIMKNFNCN
jgi:hypothetical protein